MCKDPTSGKKKIRANHLVEEVLESRLKRDKVARGHKVEPDDERQATKKRKKMVKEAKAVKLNDALVAKYEEVLARIDNYSDEELGELIAKYNIKTPAT